MRSVGLVFLCKNSLEPNSIKTVIYEGRIITEQFKSKPLVELLDVKRSMFFEKLLIVHKDKRVNKVIEVLGSIELPQFIVQIYANGPTK